MWRHLDSCQFKTILVANVLRVQCLEHGVKSIAVPGPRNRFTMLFRQLAHDVLCAT